MNEIDNTPESRPNNILEDAMDVTGKQRPEVYGHPLDNFSNIAALWEIYLKGRMRVTHTVDLHISPRDVAMLNVLTKVAREIKSPHRDNLVDIAGYARTVEMIDEELINLLQEAEDLNLMADEESLENFEKAAVYKEDYSHAYDKFLPKDHNLVKNPLV